MRLPRPTLRAGAASSAQRRVAVTVGAAQFLHVFNLSSINVAVPVVQGDLRLSGSLLPWVVSAYPLAFGAIVLIGGKLADVIGPRRMLPAGLGLMAVAALLATLAPNGVVFLAARGLAGVGAAVTIASAMEIIGRMDDAVERRRALLAFGVVGAAGFGSGLLLGGFVVTVLGWRWLFALTVPAALATAGYSVLRLPRASASGGRLNVVGAVMVVGAAMSLLVGTTLLARTGNWNAPSTVCLAGVGVFVALAVASERRASHPIFPRPLWTRRGIGLLLLVAGMLYGGWMCANFYLALVLQRSLEYSPTVAGAALSLFGISALPASRLAAWWLARGGGELPMLALGLVVQCASTAALALVEPGVPYLAFAPLLFLTMAGQTVAWIAVNNLVLRSAAPGHHGIAVGLLNGALQMGGGIGLGVVALTVGALLPATASTDAGYRVAFLVAASVIGLAVPLAGLLQWRVRRIGDPQGRPALAAGPQAASGARVVSDSAASAPRPPVPSVSSRADLDSGSE